MNRYILITAILLCSTLGLAQQYERSGGIRLGFTSGLTYKKFIHQEEAIELLLSGRKNGMQLTTMYVFHHPMEISFNENFFVYYGLGGHVGYEKYGNLRRVATSYDPDPPAWTFESDNYFIMGADALIGVEYRWLSVPLTVGFDIKPYFNFIGMRYTNGRFWDASLSFKYVF